MRELGEDAAGGLSCGWVGAAGGCFEMGAGLVEFALIQQRHGEPEFGVRLIGLEGEDALELRRGFRRAAGGEEHVGQVLMDLNVVCGFLCGFA